jgi:hypothetical protein
MGMNSFWFLKVSFVAAMVTMRGYNIYQSVIHQSEIGKEQKSAGVRHRDID